MGGELTERHREDLAIPSELQLTLRGENFLAYDSGSDDRERLVIFSTEQSSDLFESTPQWHADGTSKCCSALFNQLYTVHGVLNGYTIPLVYMLLKRKSKELYLSALTELKGINPCLQPSQITFDFEIAFQLGMRFAQPTIAKFLRYLRGEQSFTENGIAGTRAGEFLPLNVKVERHHQHVLQILSHYQNYNLSVLKWLSFNFEFWL